MSKIYALQTEQKIPASLEEVWEFMCSPANLKHITPAHLGFSITNEDTLTNMYSGQIISYYVKPVLGIPMRWVTEITHVEDKKYFVDEQRFGPYALWHHKHFLEEIEGGVIMKDLVHYKLPFGFLGSIGIGFVKSQLKQIFDYRFKALEEKWGIFNPKQQIIE